MKQKLTLRGITDPAQLKRAVRKTLLRGAELVGKLV
jgi:hypothetical protein